MQESDSRIGFEAFTRAMINDGDLLKPNKEIMNPELEYVGIAHEIGDDYSKFNYTWNSI